MDGTSITQLVLAILGPTGLAAFLTAIYTKKKITAEAKAKEVDAVQILSAASVALIAPLKEQIHDLSSKLQKTERRADELSEQLYQAKSEISHLRLEIAKYNRNFNME